MRISKDKTSYHASSIIRRDSRHIKSLPETAKHRGQKDTRRWCKGKKGVEHVKIWESHQRWGSDFWEQRCKTCQKKFETWFDSEWCRRPKPKGIP